MRPSTVIGGLFLLVVGLGLLAIPFLKAPGNAEGAQRRPRGRTTSLASGDVESAEASVQSARRHADQVQDAMQGIGGDIWSLVPVVGEPVVDVRHLGNALDHLTTAAEVAVEAWPAVNGEDATLFERPLRRRADPRTLVGAVDEASLHLDTAADRAAARSTTPRSASAPAWRRRATRLPTWWSPLAASARRAKPLAEALPDLFGADDDRTYLLALLNPSEQRFSGGAPLTLAPMRRDRRAA